MPNDEDLDVAMIVAEELARQYGVTDPLRMLSDYLPLAETILQALRETHDITPKPPRGEQ